MNEWFVWTWQCLFSLLTGLCVSVRIITVSWDKKIVAWDLETGQTLVTLLSDQQPSSLFRLFDSSVL